MHEGWPFRLVREKSGRMVAKRLESKKLGQRALLSVFSRRINDTVEKKEMIPGFNQPGLR